MRFFKVQYYIEEDLFVPSMFHFDIGLEDLKHQNLNHSKENQMKIIIKGQEEGDGEWG